MAHFSSRSECLTADLDDAAYSKCTLLDDWPVGSNRFLQRIVAEHDSGLFLKNISVECFAELAGLLLQGQPSKAITFVVDIGSLVSNSTISIHLLEISHCGMPPLSAENAGFLNGVLRSLGKSTPAVTLTISSQALFWIKEGVER